MIVSSVQESFDLHLLAPDAMRFVPVNFSESGHSVHQPDLCSALELPSPSRAERPTKPHDIPNPTTHGNRFDFIDFTNDFKIHRSIVGSIVPRSNLKSVVFCARPQDSPI
jgi:hypothetical protein